MNTFYIREANNNWTATPAKTLTAAKRAASRAQMFQGTDIHVGKQQGDKIITVASKAHRDALNMAAKGEWQDL